MVVPTAFDRLGPPLVACHRMPPSPLQNTAPHLGAQPGAVKSSVFGPWHQKGLPNRKDLVSLHRARAGECCRQRRLWMVFRAGELPPEEAAVFYRAISRALPPPLDRRAGGQWALSARRMNAAWVRGGQQCGCVISKRTSMYARSRAASSKVVRGLRPASDRQPKKSGCLPKTSAPAEPQLRQCLRSSCAILKIRASAVGAWRRRRPLLLSRAAGSRARKRQHRSHGAARCYIHRRRGKPTESFHEGRDRGPEPGAPNPADVRGGLDAPPPHRTPHQGQSQGSQLRPDDLKCQGRPSAEGKSGCLLQPAGLQAYGAGTDPVHVPYEAAARDAVASMAPRRVKSPAAAQHNTPARSATAVRRSFLQREPTRWSGVVPAPQALPGQVFCGAGEAGLTLRTVVSSSGAKNRSERAGAVDTVPKARRRSRRSCFLEVEAVAGSLVIVRAGCSWRWPRRRCRGRRRAGINTVIERALDQKKSTRRPVHARTDRRPSVYRGRAMGEIPMDTALPAPAVPRAVRGEHRAGRSWHGTLVVQSPDFFCSVGQAASVHRGR